MKRILLATDGSQVAEDAAAFLSRLPMGEELQITVASILHETKSFHREAPESWIRESFEAQTDALKASFKRIEALLKDSDAVLDHHLASGHAGKEIVELGKKLDVDLIVIGAKGHSTLSRVLLGSTSDFVATHAASSVLVVRPPERAEKQPLRIDLAFDDSEPAHQMLDEFRQVQWGEDVHARIVTVLQSIDGPFGRIEPEAEEVSHATWRSSRVRESVQDVAPHCDVEIHQHDHLADGLVEAINANKTDLVFLGEHDRSAFDRILLGSVSRFVLRHVRSSVWIARSNPSSDDSARKTSTESITAAS